MRDAIETLNRKLALSQIGEQTDWKEGYAAGITDAIDVIQEGIDNLITVGNNYFVIMYHNGDKYLPYIEEMRLYKISIRTRKSYCFSRNLSATRFNTPKPDLVLASEKGLRERVFFTKEKAEEAIRI